MIVWRMYLIDNRDESSRSNDTELKFRICLEKSMLGIGWCINGSFDSWKDYLQIADMVFDKSKGYSTAMNKIQEMAKGDLVWLQNPISRDYYIAQVCDDSPSLCCHLREFDLYSYRKAEIYPVDKDLIEKYSLTDDDISGRHTIENIHKQAVVDATCDIFNKVK